jgi:hypothetical protein
MNSINTSLEDKENTPMRLWYDKLFNEYRYWYGMLAVVIILKLILIFVLLPQLSGKFASHYGQGVYADGYDRLAINLATGHGYRFFPDTALTLMREPGYPIFLAGIFVLFGKSMAATQVANLILSIAVVFLIRKILDEFWPQGQVPSLASVLFLIHPGIIIAESRGGYEILFMVFVCWFVLLLQRASRTEKAFDYIKAGFILGLCSIVKSTVMLFPFFFLVYQILVSLKSHEYNIKVFRNFALMSLSFLLVLFPWIFRNYLLVDRIIPTASVLGVSAHAGQYIAQNLSLSNTLMAVDLAAAKERSEYARELGFSFKDGYYQYFYNSNDEVKFSSLLMRSVVNTYIERPELLIKSCMLNAFGFWFAGKNWNVTLINICIQLPLIILAVYGVWQKIINRDHNIMIIVLAILCYYCVYIPILGQARYSVPLLPFLWISACIGVCSKLSVRRLTA